MNQAPEDTSRKQDAPPGWSRAPATQLPRYWQLSFLPLLSILFAFVAVVYPSDPDLGYHLTIGDTILATGAIPRTDLFRFDSAAPEIAYSWFPDLVLAQSYRAFGVAGLKAWVIGSTFVLGIAMIQLVGGRGRRWLEGLTLLALSIGSLQVCGARPRLWASICFVVLLILLRNGGWKPSRRDCMWMVLLVVIWANIHISVTLAPPVIFLFYLGAGLASQDATIPIRGVALACLSALALLVNPYHFNLLLLGNEFSPWGQAGVAHAIVELRGITQLRYPYPVWTYPAALLFLIACARLLVTLLTGSSLARRFRDEVVGYFLILICCVGLSVSSARHVHFLLVSAAALLSSANFNPVIAARAPVIGLISYLVITLSGLVAGDRGKNWYDESFSETRYPVRALDSALPVLRAHRADAPVMRIFAPFGRGHFITWWLHEHQLTGAAAVFVDGRTDALGKARFLATESILREPCIEDLMANDFNLVLADESSELYGALMDSAEFAPLGGDQIVAFIPLNELHALFDTPP